MCVKLQRCHYPSHCNHTAGQLPDIAKEIVNFVQTVYYAINKREIIKSHKNTPLKLLLAWYQI